MDKNPWIAGLLSALFPGLGQVYAGKYALGGAFMLAFIIIGNLNAIWLSLYGGLSTDLSFFSHTFPRLLHDVFAIYGIIFWVWQVVNAYRTARKTKIPGESYE